MAYVYFVCRLLELSRCRGGVDAYCSSLRAPASITYQLRGSCTCELDKLSDSPLQHWCRDYPGSGGRPVRSREGNDGEDGRTVPGPPRRSNGSWFSAKLLHPYSSSASGYAQYRPPLQNLIRAAPARPHPAPRQTSEQQQQQPPHPTHAWTTVRQGPALLHRTNTRRRTPAEAATHTHRMPQGQTQQKQQMIIRRVTSGAASQTPATDARPARSSATESCPADTAPADIGLTRAITRRSARGDRGRRRQRRRQGQMGRPVQCRVR